jgi:hypothetical protein
MNDQEFREALRALAHEEIPESMNHWNQIQSKLKQQARPSNFTWALVRIAAIVLVLGFTLMSVVVGLAVLSKWRDPGMRSVEDAGHMTPVQMTAVVESFVTPTASPSLDATPLGTVQSGDVTATLDTIYADELRFAATFTVRNLPPATLTDSSNQYGDYHVQTDISYADGSLFNAAGGWQVNPGPEPNSISVQATFDPHEPIPPDGKLNVIFQVCITSYTPCMPPGFPTPSGGGGQSGILYTFRFPVTLSVEKATELQVNQTVTANGINMTMRSIFITSSAINLVLCYDLPPSFIGWDPQVTITVDGEKGERLNGGGVPGTKTTGKFDPTGMTEACQGINFWAPFKPGVQHQIVVHVDRLQVSPNETITDDVIQRANERLAAQGIVVQFKFGGQGYDILRKPENMDDTEVDKAVFDALSEQYPGPWEFNINIP